MAELLSRFRQQQALMVRLCVGLSLGVALAYLMDIATVPPSHFDIWTSVATSVLLLSAFILWAGAATLRRFDFHYVEPNRDGLDPLSGVAPTDTRVKS